MSLGRDLPLSKTLSHSGITLLQPYLTVRYINPHSGKHLDAKALIDTGADVCLFPANYAELLDHNVTAGNEVIITLPNDVKITTYEHTMQMAIPGFMTEEVKILVGMDIKEPLLGVTTFLTNFVLTIDYPNETFSLRKPDCPHDISSWPTP